MKVAELSDTDIDRISPYFNFWAVRCIQTTAISQFRNNRLTFTELDNEPQQQDAEVWDVIRQAEEVIGSAYWYDRELFRLYLDEGGLRKTAKTTGIPIKSIRQSVSKTISQIRKNVLS